VSVVALKPGQTRRIDVPTAGDPVEALAVGLARFSTPGAVIEASVRHDDGCPAIPAGPMSLCTCEIVAVKVKRHS
jgi:hypothetical protein